MLKSGKIIGNAVTANDAKEYKGIENFLKDGGRLEGTELLEFAKPHMDQFYRIYKKYMKRLKDLGSVAAFLKTGLESNNPKAKALAKKLHGSDFFVNADNEIQTITKMMSGYQTLLSRTLYQRQRNEDYGELVKDPAFKYLERLKVKADEGMMTAMANKKAIAAAKALVNNVHVNDTINPNLKDTKMEANAKINIGKTGKKDVSTIAKDLAKRFIWARIS